MKCTATIRTAKHLVPRAEETAPEYTRLSMVDCALPEGHSGPHTPNPLLLLLPALDLSDRTKGLWVLSEE